MKENSKKRVLIYCRESRDDNYENYERIETQRDLLIKYCKVNGYINIIDIIMDDDKSGTDFSRFNEIKKRVEKKEIDVIVFKNSARLGRNQKESLSFVEYLEEQGVEIIFEDEQYNEEMFGLYAWFNERRARDDSKNIRRNLRHKIEEGKLIVKPIYGYDKNEKKLVINNKTSKIVKEIFELYIKGKGYQEIANILNSKKIPTPSKSRGYINAKQSDKWNSQNIRRIINDQRYKGSYIGGITEKISFKSKKTRMKKQNEWIVIDNNHKAIIDNSTWNKVLEIKSKIKITNRITNSNINKNKYLGLIYCGKCKSIMYKRKSNNRPDSYICKKYVKEGKEKKEINYGCTSHRIKVKDIDKYLNQFVCKTLNNKNVIKYIIDNIQIKQIEKEELIKTQKHKELELENIKNKYTQIYEDKLNEIIPEFIYNEKRKEIEKEINKINIKIEEIKIQIEKNKKTNSKKEYIQEIINEIKEKGLKTSELEKLIKKIEVFKKSEISKKEMEKYNITKDKFYEIKKQGGIIFYLNNK